MYHILQYLKSYPKKSHKDSKLIAGKDRKVLNTIGSDTIWMSLFLGLIEILPFLVGLGLSLSIEKSLFKFDYLIFGLILSVGLIFLFRRFLPEMPIGLKEKM